MILKVSVFIVSFIASGALSASIDCNVDSCAKPSIVLEGLGCKAVKNPKSCCAKRFDCPDFDELDENMCSFEGKEYKIGEILPRSLASNTKCVETCFCTRQDNEPAKFTCTAGDCGASSFDLPGCLNIYGDLNECCSTSVVCDEAEKEMLATCFVGEKEYREGEKFIPESHKCYECLCHKDFDNKTIADNVHCRKLDCEIELKYKSFVQRGCLPVFNNEKCCPVDWECPKLVKKIIKRSANEDESQTEKQNVFVVTPSKNLEEYLAEVKVSDQNEFLTSTSGAPLIDISTEATSSPTLSTNPFVPPSDLVTVPVSVRIEDETTTSSLKALIEAETTVTTLDATTNTATSPAETSTVSITSEKTAETSQSTPEPSSVSPTTSSTTQASTTKSEDDSKESDEEEENTNLFGEEVEENDKEDKESDTTVSPSTELARSLTETVPVTTVSTSETDSASSTSGTTQALTSLETSQPSSTTETSKEAVKVLEQPEELTTLAPEATTNEVASTVQVSTTISAVESATGGEEIASVQQFSTEPSTSSTESPTTTQEPSTTAQEATTKIPTTEQATVSDNVSPTEFEKLLTTLREFVAKVDSVTSTEASSTTISTEETKVEQQIEFVNFTVSSEKHEEAPKSISKRSVDDADLIPRYFKHQSNKDKVCVYNGQKFKVGEVIKTDNECLKCLCEYAPIGHCVLKDKCNL